MTDRRADLDTLVRETMVFTKSVPVEPPMKESAAALLKRMLDQPLVDNEIPGWCALTVVAPIVRFNDFEIFTTPTFFLARDFISRSVFP
jgi:hypothetical protein